MFWGRWLGAHLGHPGGPRGHQDPKKTQKVSFLIPWATTFGAASILENGPGGIFGFCFEGLFLKTLFESFLGPRAPGDRPGVPNGPQAIDPRTYVFYCINDLGRLIWNSKTRGFRKGPK